MKYKLVYLLLAATVLFACQNASTSDAEEATDMADTQIANTDQIPDWDFSELYSLGMDTMRVLPFPVSIGDTIAAFAAPTNTGNIFDLDAAASQGPVVVMFYRGAWCPVCIRYLAAFQDSVKMIQDAGAQLIAITPETVENVKQTKEKSGFEVPVVSDEGGALSKQFGIEFYVTEAYQKKIKDKYNSDIARSNGASEALLPIPGTFILDANRVVTYTQIDPNYRKRASAKEILEHLGRE